MSQREQKRKATDLDKPIAQKMPRINIGNNADCQSTHSEALRQVFCQKEINQEGWALPVCSLEGKLQSAKSKYIAIIVPVGLL